MNFAGGPPSNISSFTNVQSSFYWLGTEYAPDTDLAWVFRFEDGSQSYGSKGISVFSAWAVRPVAVPEPGTLLLLGTGLSGMFVLRKKTRRLHG